MHLHMLMLRLQNNRVCSRLQPMYTTVWLLPWCRLTSHSTISVEAICARASAGIAICRNVAGFRPSATYHCMQHTRQSMKVLGHQRPKAHLFLVAAEEHIMMLCISSQQQGGRCVRSTCMAQAPHNSMQVPAVQHISGML